MLFPFIASTGVSLSTHRLSQEDILAAFPGSDTRVVVQAVGVQTRYWATDPHSGEVDLGSTTTPLAIRAVQDALSRWEGDPGTIGCLIVTTVTPETELPQISARIQQAIPLGDLQLLDLRSGCAGVVQALGLAATLIRSGLHRNVVVVGVDCFSPVNVPRIRFPGQRSVEDLMDAIMLSDLAAAAVVSSSTSGDASLRLTFHGAGAPLSQVEAGLITEPLMPVPRLPGTAAGRRREKSVRVVNNHALIRTWLPRVIEAALQRAEELSGYRWNDFSSVVGPQANPGLIRAMARKVAEDCGDTPDHGVCKPWFVGDRFGNCPGAAILHAFHELVKEGHHREGSRTLLLGAESPKWLHAVAGIEG